MKPLASLASRHGSRLWSAFASINARHQATKATMLRALGKAITVSSAKAAQVFGGSPAATGVGSVRHFLPCSGATGWCRRAERDASPRPSRVSHFLAPGYQVAVGSNRQSLLGSSDHVAPSL